jgi:hypothetical protein
MHPHLNDISTAHELILFENIGYDIYKPLWVISRVNSTFQSKFPMSNEYLKCIFESLLDHHIQRPQYLAPVDRISSRLPKCTALTPTHWRPWTRADDVI